jgi:hypothetical protein
LRHLAAFVSLPAALAQEPVELLRQRGLQHLREHRAHEIGRRLIARAP